MEKILRWWTQFLVELEAGKRIIAIFIIICSVLTYALIKNVGKLQQANEKAVIVEKNHSDEVSRIKDSASAAIVRITTYYNEKTESIYKDQINALNEVEKGYKIIKKKNDKIVSNIK